MTGTIVALAVWLHHLRRPRLLLQSVPPITCQPGSAPGTRRRLSWAATIAGGILTFDGSEILPASSGSLNGTGRQCRRRRRLRFRHQHHAGYPQLHQRPGGTPGSLAFVTSSNGTRTDLLAAGSLLAGSKRVIGVTCRGDSVGQLLRPLVQEIQVTNSLAAGSGRPGDCPANSYNSRARPWIAAYRKMLSKNRPSPRSFHPAEIVDAPRWNPRRHWLRPILVEASFPLVTRSDGRLEA